MIRNLYGFLVEIDTQVLVSGDWGSDDCEWEWDSKYHYFISRDDAEKFFNKSKKVFKDRSADRVAMYYCDMTYNGATMIGSEIGDPIKEYGFDGGRVIVIEDL